MPHLLFKTCRSFPKYVTTSDMVETVMMSLKRVSQVVHREASARKLTAGCQTQDNEQ